MLRLDTESIGLMGPVTLIQWAKKGEQPTLWNVWEETIDNTLIKIRDIINQPLLIFNASHDSFKLHQLYNTLILHPDKHLPPDPDKYYALERESWKNAIALKPPKVLDYYLILKKFFFPDIGQRKPFEIYRVPIQASEYLFRQLEEIKLHPLLFKKYKNKTSKWSITPDDDNFVNFKLDFNPSLSLKNIINHLFGIETKSIQIPPHMQPEEKEWDPYGCDWRPLFKFHTNWWYKNQYARQYASEDIQYLDMLEAYINDQSVIDFDQDSELAWMVGACRFKGYPIDIELLDSLISDIQANKKRVPTSPQAALRYLHAVCPPLLKATIQDTSDPTLQTIIKECDPNDEETIELIKRATEISQTREQEKQEELFRKLQLVGRFFPDFNVCGTASNRMSGRGGINPQGINKDVAIRSIFTLHESEGESLCGGDFDGQEVTIFDAIINDPTLRKMLQSGVKLHSVFASYLFNIPLEEMNEKNYPSEYYKGKQCVFATIYGAQAQKLSQVSGLSIEEVTKAMNRLMLEIPGIGRALTELTPLYSPATQEGIGRAVKWNEPKDIIGSLFGYNRSFRLDVYMAKNFFRLASTGVRDLKNLTMRVVRKDREQSVMGATQSALYAAMFSVFSSMLRVANNHRIQATGAGVTKKLQYDIWQLQPQGCNPFVVAPLNVHDEVVTPTTCPTQVAEVVAKSVEEMRTKIPLLKIKWKSGLEDWSGVKG